MFQLFLVCSQNLYLNQKKEVLKITTITITRAAMLRMKILQSVRNFSESQDTRAAKKIAILQKNAILQISKEKFLKIQKVGCR